MGSIAAKDDNRRYALLLHHPGGAECVFNRARYLVVEIFKLGEMLKALIFRPVDAAADMVTDAAILRHHQDAIDARCLETGENAEHDVGAVGDLQRRCIGDDPPDVAG